LALQIIAEEAEEAEQEEEEEEEEDDHDWWEMQNPYEPVLKV
jgi:hypothetical protein